MIDYILMLLIIRLKILKYRMIKNFKFYVITFHIIINFHINVSYCLFFHSRIFPINYISII